MDLNYPFGILKPFFLAVILNVHSNSCGTNCWLLACYMVVGFVFFNDCSLLVCRWRLYKVISKWYKGSFCTWNGLLEMSRWTKGGHSNDI